MRKGLVYGALCALTLAVPAAAEKIFVPILGPTATDGSTLATKVWVADAERQVSTGQTGLMAIEAGSIDEVRATLGRNGAEVPVFTEEEAYQADLEVPLDGLPRQRAMASLLVGAANLSEKTSFCKAAFFDRDDNRLGEVAFEVEPMSLTRKAALGSAGRFDTVRVTCDQSFYPFAVATTKAKSSSPIIAKGIGPNGPCQTWLAILKQPNGHYVTQTDPGAVFHEATKANPKGIVCFRTEADLRVGKAVFQWDTTLGPWSSRNKSGLHNLAYFFLDRYRSGVVGNVNAAGPNKNFLKVMQNIGMAPGTNTNKSQNYAMTTGLTYHSIYTYDANNKQATLEVQLNGLTVSKFSFNCQPGNNQTLIIKRYGTGTSVGLAMVGEFGNYVGQHPPEEATIGWKYSNLKVDLTPK